MPPVADDLFHAVPLLVQPVVAGTDGITVGDFVAGDATGGDRHRGRVDALGAEFGVQGVRPVAQARRGQARVGQERCGDRGGHAGGQQQCSHATGAHLRQYLSDGRHRAQHMQLVLRAGGLHRGLRGGGDRSGRAGTVLQDIDRSQLRRGTAEGAGQRVTVPDVGGERRCCDAEFGQLSHQSVQGVLAPGDQPDLEAVAAESPGHAHPQPWSGTDNDERLRHHNIPSHHSGWAGYSRDRPARQLLSAPREHLVGRATPRCRYADRCCRSSPSSATSGASWSSDNYATAHCASANCTARSQGSHSACSP